MKPSEIADWLDGFVVDEADYDPLIIHKAATTIRAQAEALKIAMEALDYYADPLGFVGTGAARKALARIKEVG